VKGAAPTYAGTFRHWGDTYVIVSRFSPEAVRVKYGVPANDPKKAWAIVRVADDKVVWRGAKYQNARRKKTALIAGISVRQARGLPF
jgi:hypothetical protein